MESLFVLLGLAIIVGPFVLFFLVLGARRRIEVLEHQVDHLQEQLSEVERRARPAAASIA